MLRASTLIDFWKESEIFQNTMGRNAGFLGESSFNMTRGGGVEDFERGSENF